MNEVQLIRREIAAQRRHASEAAAGGASSSESQKGSAYTVACVEYIELIIKQERLRLEAHLERLRARRELTEAERQMLERCAAFVGAMPSVGTGDAPGLSEPDAAIDPVRRLARARDLLSRIEPVAHEIEAVAERCYGIDDWRRTSHVDADSILEARRMRKRVLEHADGGTVG